MRTTRKPTRPLLGALLAAFFLAAPAAFASGARCELTAIEASNPDKGIDPELSGIKELTKPPLSTTYSRFKFLGKAEAELEPEKEKELVPTKAYPTQLTFKGVDASGKLKLRVDLPAVKFNADLALKSGANFMIARTLPDDRALLMAVKCDLK